MFRRTPMVRRTASRGLRAAIGEGEQYTPLALRSHALWREIERETGTRLLTTQGLLIISSPGKTAFTHVEAFYENTVGAAKKYGIPHELLDAQQIRRRFPQFKVRDDEVGYFEMDAGFLRPEECVQAQLRLAQHHGAAIHTGEKSLASTRRRRSRYTSRNYSASHLIVTAGPCFLISRQRWSRYFKISSRCCLGSISSPRPRVLRNASGFIWGFGGRAGIYGFPAVDGPHGSQDRHRAVSAKPRPIRLTERRRARNQGNLRNLRRRISGVSGKCLGPSPACTVTPDFWHDTHPDFERVLIVAPWSGHGFKHSPAIGEALSELIIDGASRLDLSGFTIKRFETSGVR
jgi:sarcosine oxidase